MSSLRPDLTEQETRDASVGADGGTVEVLNEVLENKALTASDSAATAPTKSAEQQARLDALPIVRGTQHQSSGQSTYENE